ncbi:MAG: ribonuclease Y [Thermoleophilaceae bacterium]|jgi:ribonuclease Y|nr:ribonuclease Y [Thermoleophilaceae bacterium]MDQ3319088.1 ribonuclease Y [Actinomycetota bacterium]
MEIVLVVLAVLAAGAAVAVVATTHRARRLRPQSGALGGDGPGRAVPSSPHSVALTGPSLGGGRLEEGSEPSAGPSTADLREQLDLELVQRRAEVGRIEERLLGKEQSIDVRIADLERRERAIADRQRNLEQSQEEIKCARRDQLLELERIAGLTAGQAKQIMLRELEDELEHDSARKIRQAEEEGRREADRRARSILATSMQRLAAGHAVETTVSVVQLRSDDLKGRIIGREGRNIRSLETLTGIDFIVDDTPSTVVLSGFDGVRREIARITLEKLLEDGRIHPARIEDAYDQAVAEMEGHIVEVGEQAVFDAEAGTLHGELTKLLGKLRYRTSYGQNVLAHSVECANLAGTLAAELGASPKTARRAALLHDIGKAVTHEIQGPHALVGGDIARRYGEAEAVAHAMEAHHNEVELQTIEAVVVQVADSLSGARPGARGESLEHYVKRLRDLEGIATRHPGVEKVFAMQAGREVRVIVSPADIDDDAAALLSHAIARDVEKELEYPGQIKVTVIRESRAVDYAK